MITAHNHSLLQQSDALYERYGKPLEKTHREKYVAISQEGKTLIADTVFALMQEAKTRLGPGNFIFEIRSSCTAILPTRDIMVLFLKRTVYASWTQNRSHHSPHPCAAPDIPGMAAGHQHPCWPGQTWPHVVTAH